jgi:hypothetical protein
MNLKLVKINKGDSGTIHFENGSVVLVASKRSVLLKGRTLKVGDLYALALKRA